MKTIFFISYLILLSPIAIFGQSPFAYGTYVNYDESIDVNGSTVIYPDFNYRSDQENYNYNAKLTMFIYANDRIAKVIRKPFVFVEGISFDKKAVTINNYSYDNYFEQTELLSENNETYEDRPDLELMRIANNPGNNPPVGYSTFNWATLVSGIDAEGLALNDPLKVQKSPDLLNKLICAGYDIVFIDFLSGQQYIENNGEALFSALSQLKQMMVENGSPEKMVICGASMGGLVARYAIKKHEFAGHNDWFSHFISFDSPQMGANIPLGMQYLTKHFYFKPLTNWMVKDQYEKMTCPAASQLVKYSCLETNMISQSVYTDASPSLERLAMLLNPNIAIWPSSCRNISITNGSRLGTIQNMGTYGNCDHYFEFDGLMEINLKSLPFNNGNYCTIMDFEFGNFCLPALQPLLAKDVNVRNSQPLDFMAGSYRRDINDLRKLTDKFSSTIFGMNGGCDPNAFSNVTPLNDTKICFIPLLSSSGYKNFDQVGTNSQAVTNSLFQGREKFEDPQHNFSHFDVVYAPVDNQTHVEITDENIEWVMTELIAKKDLVFQNEVIPNGTHVARETIKAGWDVDKYGDNCAQLFHPSMYPQYNYTPNYIQTCGPVSTAPNMVVVLHAGNRIELHPGFSTTNAAYFEASILDDMGCGTPSSGRYAQGAEEVSSDGLTASLSPFIPSDRKVLNTTDESIFFVLAPNPTQGTVLLKSNSEEAKHIEIRDVQGRLLAQMQSNLRETSIDLSDLPVGLYYVSSSGLNHRFVSKVLKE